MKREKVQNEYMYDTKVENMFINEYMISAPGDFVKIYLVALMYADLNKEIDDEKLSKITGIDVDDIARCWKYWEDLKIISREKGEIVFNSLKEGMYGLKKKSKTDETKIREPISQESLQILVNSDIKDMFSDIAKIIGRPVTGSESDKVIEWIEVFGATIEVIIFAFKYCYDRKKTDVRYIAQVVKGWTGRGLKTVSQVEDFIEVMDQRHYQYKRVMKALGFTHRNPTEAEKEMMDKWFDEEGISIGQVLEACKKTSGISNPNFNYINSVLIGQKKDKAKSSGKTVDGKVSRKVVMEYYEYIREKAEAEAKERHDEVLSGLPVIGELEKQIRDNYTEMTTLAISGTVDKQQRIRAIKQSNSDLQKRIDRTLTGNGIPIDYMNVHYKCPICKDTGTLESGQICSCYMQRAEEAADWER